MRQDKDGKSGRITRARYGAVSTVILLLVLALAVLANVLAQQLERKNGWRVDFSFNSETTQSETTRQILAELTHPVHIYALFTRGQEDKPLMELLDRYAAESRLVTWEQTDVSLNPGLITRFGGGTASDASISSDSVIVSCEDTGRFRILSPSDFISLSYDYDAGTYEIAGLTYESRLTEAIVYVTREKIPKVRFAQGHGELGGSELEPFTELLEKNNFEVSFVNLRSADTVLSEEELLVLASPVSDLLDSELEKIMAFTSAGGRLLISCDYSDPVGDMPNYQALLRYYGVSPKTGIVIGSEEEPDTYYENVRIYLIPELLSTDMTIDLVASGADTLLLTGARAFEMPSESDSALTVSAILQSGRKAYLRDVSSDDVSIEQQDGDETGPFVLALQSQRITAAGCVSKAVVIGCSTILTDRQVQSMTDAQEFLVTVAKYLSGGEPVDLGIMPRTAVRPQLSARSLIPGSVILTALPLGVLAAALLVLVPRRHR